MLGPTESRSSENRSKAGVLSRDHGEYFRETVMDADEKVKILQAFVNANKEAKKRMAHVEKLFAPDSPDVKKKEGIAADSVCRADLG